MSTRSIRCAIALIAAWMAACASAQYPNRLVRLVGLGRDRVDPIGLALEGRLHEGQAKSACVSPSGITDIMTRMLAERPSEKFGQQFIVDNRTGAGLLWTVAECHRQLSRHVHDCMT
jgi:hypothetical protein